MNYTIELPANYVKPPLPGRDKWCAALRNGHYKQGKNRLRMDAEEVQYCCLGVLSEINGDLKDGKDCGESRYGLSCLSKYYDYLDSAGRFPTGVSVRCKEEFTCLAKLNDNDFTFAQIADIIEAIWENQE